MFVEIEGFEHPIHVDDPVLEGPIGEGYDEENSGNDHPTQ